MNNFLSSEAKNMPKSFFDLDPKGQGHNMNEHFLSS